MDLQTVIYSAASLVLGIGVVSFYVAKLTNLLKQVADVLIAVQTALEDNAVSKVEVDLIVKEAKEVVDAVKAFKK